MEYAIEMLNITKRFPGIVANDNITLQLRKGEIHALLGENGAGSLLLLKKAPFCCLHPQNNVVKDTKAFYQLKMLMHHSNAQIIGIVWIVDRNLLPVFVNLSRKKGKCRLPSFQLIYLGSAAGRPVVCVGLE